MPFVLESYQRFAELTGVSPVCACCSPLTLAAQLRGTKALIMDMYRDPAFVDRLLTFLSQEVVVPWIRKLIEATGASTVVMWDAEARPPIMSPSLIRRFCQPHVEAVIRETSSPTCTVIDGRSDRCEGWVAGASLVTDVKLLDIRPEILRDGPREQIVDAVCQTLEQGESEGRFTLLMRHIPIDTPIENLRTVVTAVKQFGRYPISKRLSRRTFRSPEVAPFRVSAPQPAH